MNPWTALLNAIWGVLDFFHSALVGTFGLDAWGWAIILLTVVVRIVLLPLAVKQTRSQRAMQGLQPEMKKIQNKYKADKGLMKSDPEKYRELRAKQQEAMMGLYKEHGVNPASGCLPLLLQMPIFFALFRVLQPSGNLPEEASFYIFDNLSAQVSAAGAAGWFMVALMAGTTYYSARQMMASTAATGQQQQQQKIMMYAMPVMLAVFSVQMYIGVLIYWVTTNIWTIGQQYVMFRATHTQDKSTPPAKSTNDTNHTPEAPGKPPKTAKKSPKTAGTSAKTTGKSAKAAKKAAASKAAAKSPKTSGKSPKTTEK